MICKLEDEIEIIRKQMIEAANFDGIAADVTMELSQKLDELINHYHIQLSKIGNEEKH